MGRNEEPVSFEVEVVHDTESDIKVCLDGADEDEAVWIPRSLISGDVETTGDAGTIEVPEWFALKEGLI